MRCSTPRTGPTVSKKATEQQPDLILMDIIMPDINGFQATRQLSKDAATKDIPIIVVTTKDQETDRVWGMRQGASEFLVKPVDEKALARQPSGSSCQRPEALADQP